MSDQDQEKTQKATPFKLQEAKRRGQVAKSLDFNSFALLAGMLALVYFEGRRMTNDGLRIGRDIFAHAGTATFDTGSLMVWLGSVVADTGRLLLPFFMVAIVAAVFSNILQTGPVFSVFPLKPDVKRLNPVTGFKRVFSLRMLFEGAKSLVKLALFSAVAYAVVLGLLPMLLSMSAMDPHVYPRMMLDSSLGLVFKLLLIIMLVAILDILYTRWDFGKKMRMSSREMKDEVKRREGDPQIRAKVRELQREAAKRSKALRRVPDADVLITNPTHLSIALRYDRGAMRAPRVLAKGAGEVALEMRRLAARHQIPVFERKPLARQLFTEVDIDQPIPEALYEPVSRIYAAIYAANANTVSIGTSR